MIACTWNEELQYKSGVALGQESLENGVDILLAPGLNIHRNPLCGRNFEYFFEDPLVSGNAAANIVSGIQAQGVLATVKHFVCNNCETNRYYSVSLVSERALREIYLKGFEIAVKRSSPACLMTSYNYMNGIRTCENYNLLVGVLRNEWGFDGSVMTDWRVPSHQWEEIKGGNDIKMPYGYPEEIELTKQMLALGRMTRGELEASAVNVLNTVMRTKKFADSDMGKVTEIHGSGTLFKATEFTHTSSTSTAVEACLDIGGGMNMTSLGKDVKPMNTSLSYRLDVKDGGIYNIFARIATPFDDAFLEFFIDENKVGECGHINTAPETQPEVAFQSWTTLKAEGLPIDEGEHWLRVCINATDRKRGININWFKFISNTSPNKDTDPASTMKVSSSDTQSTAPKFTEQGFFS